MLIISACSTSNANSSVSDEQKEESEKTVQYTTITGKQVEIPAEPKRVVYIGQTIGDFLARAFRLLVITFPKIFLVTMKVDLKESLMLETRVT